MANSKILIKIIHQAFAQKTLEEWKAHLAGTDLDLLGGTDSV